MGRSILKSVVILALVSIIVCLIESGAGAGDWEYVDGKPLCGDRSGRYVHPKDPSMKVLCDRASSGVSIVSKCAPGATVNSDLNCVDSNGKQAFGPNGGSWIYSKETGWVYHPSIGQTFGQVG